MQLLFEILYKRKSLSLITICFNVLTAVLTIWWNAQLGDIINTVSAGLLPSKEQIQWALFTMVLLGTVNYIKGYVSGYTCESMTHDLRMGYAYYFLSLPIEESEKLNAGEQLSKLQNEITAVSRYFNDNLFILFEDIVRFLTTFIWLIFLSPVLALTTNLTVFILVAYIFWSSKIIGLAIECSQKAKGVMNQYAETLLTLFPVIRLYDAARMIIGGYTGAVKTWEEQTIMAERMRAGFMSLSAFLGSIPLLLLFWIGGQGVIKGTLTVGTLYIFLNLSGNVSGALKNMPGHIAAFRQFAANMKRLSPYIIIYGKGK